MSDWQWQVRTTYNDTVKWPKVPGELAFETRHKDDASKDIEVEIAESRGDVNVQVMSYEDPLRRVINDFRPIQPGDIEAIKQAAQMWDEIFHR